mmetsp:Transcript_12874/g.37840  ORF Transcript_12874/g.37840 Transcript_12874/m.37840 type:complete len:292 (+) Transcript_12874:14-889(+)
MIGSLNAWRDVLPHRQPRVPHYRQSQQPRLGGSRKPRRRPQQLLKLPPQCGGGGARGGDESHPHGCCGGVEVGGAEEGVEDVLGEAGAVADEVGGVGARREREEAAGPQPHPRVHRQEGDAARRDEGVQRRGEGECEAGRPDEGHRLAGEGSVQHAADAAGDDRLDDAELPARGHLHRAAERHHRRQARKVEEEGRADKGGDVLLRRQPPVSGVGRPPQCHVAREPAEEFVRSVRPSRVGVVRWVANRPQLAELGRRCCGRQSRRRRPRRERVCEGRTRPARTQRWKRRRS